MFHRHRRRHIPSGPDNFLSVLEGIEGGFAIFTGIVAGLSFQVQNHRLLVITGLISILVSGFNSSTVRYSTQHYLDELDGVEKRNKFHNYTLPALVEFLAYFLVSLIVLLPLVFIQSTLVAVMACIALTLSILFAAGYYRGWLLKTHPVKDAFELSLIGLAIISVGAASGYLLSLPF